MPDDSLELVRRYFVEIGVRGNLAILPGLLRQVDAPVHVLQSMLAGL